MTERYRIAFQEDIPSREIDDLLFWAVFNTESVFGKTKVDLDADYRFYPKTNVCEIGIEGEVNEHIAKMFRGIAAVKFGEAAFHIDRVPKRGKSR